MEHCQHHWDIEGTNLPVARAVCLNCGVTTEFRNTLTFEQDEAMQTKRRVTKAKAQTDV